MPQLASTQAIRGVSQVPCWRLPPPKAWPCRWRCPRAERQTAGGSGCPGCWQVLLPWGQVVPTVCQPAALIPGGPCALETINTCQWQQGKPCPPDHRQPGAPSRRHDQPGARVACTQLVSRSSSQIYGFTALLRVCVILWSVRLDLSAPLAVGLHPEEVFLKKSSLSGRGGVFSKFSLSKAVSQ